MPGLAPNPKGTLLRQQAILATSFTPADPFDGILRLPQGRALGMLVWLQGAGDPGFAALDEPTRVGFVEPRMNCELPS